jgi:hypothetical protein
MEKGSLKFPWLRFDRPMDGSLVTSSNAKIVQFRALDLGQVPLEIAGGALTIAGSA